MACLEGSLLLGLGTVGDAITAAVAVAVTVVAIAVTTTARDRFHVSSGIGDSLLCEGTSLGLGFGIRLGLPRGLSLGLLVSLGLGLDFCHSLGTSCLANLLEFRACLCFCSGERGVLLRLCFRGGLLLRALLHDLFGFIILAHQLAALGDDDALACLATVGAQALHLTHNVHAAHDAAEHDVLAVEVRGHGGGDEELAAVRVAAGVGHRQQPRLGVPQAEVLVVELLAVDALAPGTVATGEVTWAHAS